MLSVTEAPLSDTGPIINAAGQQRQILHISVSADPTRPASLRDGAAHGELPLRQKAKMSL